MSDYIIVGAGSAGCVLANRLSEDPSVSVTLIEAGGADAAPELHIPAAFGSLFKTAFDWDLSSDAEPELYGRHLYLPRGKVLGGSSSTNAMIYIRGNAADFDDWAAHGADGWDYATVLPYFKRAEANERGGDLHHGANGPLSVSDSHSMHPLADAFIQAAQAAGHEANPDFNGARQEGFGRLQVTQRGGMRASASVAFLHPVLERPNLELVTGAQALGIRFEGDRAVGVEVEVNGETRVLRAEREIILSAGAYGSPVLLMHSGIGPAEQLAALQIEVREDLPVGENLQDHITALVNYHTTVETLESAMTPENVELLQSEGRGPLTSNVAEAAGFVRTREGLAAPDIQFHFAVVGFYDEGLSLPPGPAYAFGPCVIKPTSRGSVRLRNADPRTKPRIVNNYLSTEADRQSMVAGLKLALDIAGQEPLARVTTGPFVVPEQTDDAGLLDFARRTGFGLYHPTSTCAIGSVVDAQLRVLGIEGLRVVDASVMPTVPRGNTNAATIMIAERAADLIRDGAAAAAKPEPVHA